MNWYDSRANLADLLRHLADNGRLTVDDAIDVAEKPWKFTVDYDEMVAERERDELSGADRAKERV